MVVLEVVSQHLEDQFTEGEEILVGFECLVVGRKPVVEDLNVDAPDDVVEEAGNTGHKVLKDGHNPHVDGFF